MKWQQVMRTILSVLLPLSYLYAGSITAVGDVMLGSAYPGLSVPDSCPKDPLHVLQSIPKTPIMFCNMEGTLLNTGEPTKQCANCFMFRMPENYVDLYKAAGFNLISLSNNHSRDFGDRGMKTTEDLLRLNNIIYASYSQPWDTFIVSGVRYGFCAFNTAWHRPEEAELVIVSMRSLCSILIVSMHSGAEGVGHSHVTRHREAYYGESRGNPYEFAHRCINAGASVILGHGPHVTRAVELYRGKFIAYSLGNFATCGFKLQGVTAIAPIIQVTFDDRGDFVSGKIYPIKQEKYMSPVLDPERAAIKEIIDLTRQDFPKTRFTITADGEIRKK